MPTLRFWFDPASTYSYIAAETVDAAAARHGVETVWTPFLLGPIFKAQGMANSPFALFPVKGRYMWRDVQRLAERAGLRFEVPADNGEGRFPRSPLLAARAAVAALAEPWGRDFVRGIYRAEFVDWRDISDPAVVASVADAAGGDGQALLEAAGSDGVKGALRANTEEAMALEIFGAPTFTVGSERFWGHDRLDMALETAAGRAAA